MKDEPERSNPCRWLLDHEPEFLFDPVGCFQWFQRVSAKHLWVQETSLIQTPLGGEASSSINLSVIPTNSRDTSSYSRLLGQETSVMKLLIVDLLPQHPVQAQLQLAGHGHAGHGGVLAGQEAKIEIRKSARRRCTG